MATYYLQYSRDSKIIANIYKYIYKKVHIFNFFSFWTRRTESYGTSIKTLWELKQWNWPHGDILVDLRIKNGTWARFRSYIASRVGRFF